VLCHSGYIYIYIYIYILGFLIRIGGLIYGATRLHVPSHWIVVFAIVMVGLAIWKGVTNTRQKDPRA